MSSDLHRDLAQERGDVLSRVIRRRASDKERLLTTEEEEGFQRRAMSMRRPSTLLTRADAQRRIGVNSLESDDPVVKITSEEALKMGYTKPTLRMRLRTLWHSMKRGAS